jgi:hypothetical protein
MGDSIRPELMFARYAYSSGGLPTPLPNFLYLDLSFEINMLNGDIRNAAMSGKAAGPMTLDFVLTGGYGGFYDDGTKRGFRASGFSGTVNNPVDTWILVEAPPYSLGDSVALTDVSLSTLRTDSTSGLSTYSNLSVVME